MLHHTQETLQATCAIFSTRHPHRQISCVNGLLPLLQASAPCLWLASDQVTGRVPALTVRTYAHMRGRGTAWMNE